MSPQADTPKDAALRIVGRTVVNFQRLEHNLRLAARLGNFQGTIQKVQREMERRQERASTLTLGQAIQAWLELCYGQPSSHFGTPDLFDVTVKTTFTIESDTESQTHHAEALSDLLKVRNDLIHSRLAKLEWERPEVCRNLVTELEQVNALISKQIDYTGVLLKGVAELYQEHVESLEAQLENGAHLVAETMPNTSCMDSSRK